MRPATSTDPVDSLQNSGVYLFPLFLEIIEADHAYERSEVEVNSGLVSCGRFDSAASTLQHEAG